MLRGWFRETYPIGPQNVRMHLPATVSQVRALRANAPLPFKKNRHRNRIHHSKVTDYEICSVNVTWRTHSCVPRRDSSRRSLVSFTIPEQASRRFSKRRRTQSVRATVHYRKVTSFRCGVALNVSNEMRSLVNKNSVSEQFRIRQFTSIATASGA